MSYENMPDPGEMRERVIQRLEPQLRLQKQKIILYAHIVLLFMFQMSIYSSHGSLYWYSAIEQDNNLTGANGLYTAWHVYPLVSVLSVLWFALLVAHIGWMRLKTSRERLIQRAMDREFELEKMRMELELAEARSNGNYNGEKAKRSLQLSDDGELVANEMEQTSNRLR